VDDDELEELKQQLLEEPPRPLLQSRQAGGAFPLLPSTQMDQWRARAVEQARRRARALEERKQQEAAIVAAQEKAQEIFTDAQTEVIGRVLAGERARFRCELAAALRAESSKAERVVDLPRLPLRNSRC
jgi:hypothetical protein